MTDNNPAKHTPRLASDIAPLTLSFDGKSVFGFGTDGFETRIAEMTSGFAIARARGTTIVTAVNQHDVLVAQVKSLREALANFTAAAEGLMSAGESEDDVHMIFEEPLRKAIQVLRETERK